MVFNDTGESMDGKKQSKPMMVNIRPVTQNRSSKDSKDRISLENVKEGIFGLNCSQLK